ncbi:hypothetical protein OGATHE_006466 [Ogataea polymorpha]|uniref:Uncharacterized protein n=1 Tax=Ogataea polymorpha TaxID=460523 RepID=A0A9P8SXH1_9ASCO|nr:hypothetical protein OGATHE_006466 [Ogataea polymorpha]
MQRRGQTWDQHGRGAVLEESPEISISVGAEAVDQFEDANDLDSESSTSSSGSFKSINSSDLTAEDLYWVYSLSSS